MMTHKLIEAAQQAAEVAKCDHELTLLRYPVGETPPKLNRYACSKCMATFYIPIVTVGK